MRSKNKQVKTAWLMSAPALVILFVFLVIPFFSAFAYSFTNRMLLMNPNNPVKFIGLTNYIRLFGDEEFFKALGNNLIFVLAVVPLQTSLALLMAVLINSKLKGINLFRTIFFSPVVITMVVVSIVWALIFTPTADGYLNSLLSGLTFGLFQPSQWLHSENSSMISIMILSIWQGVGFQMIIFLAGLQYIPEELYEAADVDGASEIQKFFRVTIPQLKNTTIFVVISTTIFAFKLFTQVMVLTEGGPKSSTTTMVYMLYREGFVKKKVGYSSAIAVVFFLIVLCISMLQNKVIKED